MANADRSPGSLPFILPMLATPAPSPTDEKGWGFEVKWDGARCVAYAPGDGSLRLVARSGEDVTTAYPELAGIGEQLAGRPCVLDGEIVVLDVHGRPDFGALQRRLGLRNPQRVARLALTLPVHLMLFDVMHLDGRSRERLPYADRRELLGGLHLAGARWSTPEYTGNGRKAWEATLEAGLEGVIAKRLDSPYKAGVRSTAWIKTKHVQTLTLPIGGWVPGRGSLAGLPGAVLVGVEEQHGLRYAGSVGSGLSETERRELAALLEVVAAERSPFAGTVDVPGARWVQPRLIAEVEASGWTSGGRLRHPSWQRLRRDLTRLG